MNNEDKLTAQQQELLDLFALDALDGKEKSEAQTLVDTDDEAKQYVNDAQKMFAQFEDNSAPSPELFAKIKEELNTTVTVVPFAAKKQTMLYSFITGAVAASIIAVIVGALLWPSSSDTRSNSAFSLTKQVNTFASQKGVESFQLHGNANNAGPEVMVHDGNIMIDARGVSGISDEYTYQLWAIVENATGKQVISVGVLGNNPGVFMARISGDVKAFAITKEVAGGVEKSSQDAMYVSDSA